MTYQAFFGFADVFKVFATSNTELDKLIGQRKISLWNLNASKRSHKSLSAFYSLKQNLSKSFPKTSKINACTG